MNHRKLSHVITLLCFLPVSFVLLQTSVHLMWEHRPLALSTIQPVSGYDGNSGYVVPIGTDWVSQDENFNSPAQLLENGKPLAFPNALHADIASMGMGRYSLWKGYLYLSTSDNSDPRINGRRYELYWPKPLNSAFVWTSYVLVILSILFIVWQSRFLLQKKLIQVKRLSYRVVLGNLALSLFGISLALVILETVLHFTETLKTHYWGGNFVAHKDLGWVFQSHLNKNVSGFAPHNELIKISTNSLGLRDTPEPDQIPSSVVVMIQGDSNIAGFGLQTEHTLSYQLQQLLNNSSTTGEQYVVLNFGIPGYDMNQYIIQAQYLSQYYKANKTVLVFNVWNDYASILKSAYYILRPYYRSSGGGLELVKPYLPVYQQVYAHQFIEPFDQYNPLIEPLNKQIFTITPDNLLSYSYLYVEVNKRLYNKGWFKQSLAPEAVAHAKLYDPYHNIWAYFPNPPQPYAIYNEVMEALFQKWADTVADPLLILLPDPPQVCEAARLKRFSEVSLEMENLDFDLPTRRVAQLAEQTNIPVINPLEEFRQIEEKESVEDSCQLWQEDFGHLNAQGWKLLAEIIQKELQKN